MSYGYNQAGALTSLTYPSGHVVSYAYSSAGRPTSAVNGTSIYYVTSATYTPGGAVMGYHNGSSITVSNTYNNRLQPDVLKAYVSTASPPDIYGFDYNFVDGSGHNNGNVQQIVNLKDSNYTQNFTYDELNRIQQGYSSGSSWGETFTIDPWGNLTNRGGVTGKTNYEPLNAAPATGTNQLNGYSYDAAGNLTNDGTSYSYDAESRISSTAGYTYTYDGDGQRVKKANSSTGTLYWMGTGNVLGESDLSGTMQYEYVFFNGKRVARRDISTGNVHYYFADHLGSTRVTTSDTGSVEKEWEYYPYGGEIPTPGSNSNHYLFTGKERDSESGLDNFGARYHGSNLGRFMTPDPLLNSGRPWEPQSWNRYAYVMNNPLRYTDPDGLYDFDTQCGDDKKCLDNQERFTAAVERLRAIASSLPKNSEQKKAIDKALGAIGTAGDGNGVTVKFGETATGGPMETFGKTITVDWQTLDSRSADFRQMGIAVDVGVEAAAGIAHEGIHLTQDSSLLNRRMFQNAFDILNYYERVAYEAQSFVNEASRSFSTGGVWNTVWADGPDKELLRQRAIREAARESTEASREDYNRRNPR